jgi:hypothetical protein
MLSPLFRGSRPGRLEYGESGAGSERDRGMAAELGERPAPAQRVVSPGDPVLVHAREATFEL